MRVSGREHFPRTGPAILAVNHASNWDPLVLGAAVGDFRRWYGIGKKEVFDVPLVGWFLRQCGGIPVDRDRGDLGAIKASLKILKEGKLYIVFPEGTRGFGKRKRRPHSGVGLFAQRSKAPVVPVHLQGTGRGLLPVYGGLKVTVGPPLFFPQGEIPKDREREAQMEFATRVMDTIYNLD